MSDDKRMNISDEAVEAALDELPIEAARFFNKARMRNILEAAAPYLMAQALLDTVSVIEDLPGTEHDAPAKGNYSAFSTFPEAWLRGRAEAYRSAGAGE
jgi:hypothetical protein